MKRLDAQYQRHAHQLAETQGERAKAQRSLDHTPARNDPVMQMMAGRLSDEEIAAIAAYFKDLE